MYKEGGEERGEEGGGVTNVKAVCLQNEKNAKQKNKKQKTKNERQCFLLKKSCTENNKKNK